MTTKPRGRAQTPKKKRTQAQTSTKRIKAAELATLQLEVETMELNLAAETYKEVRAMRLETGIYDIGDEVNEEANSDHFSRLYAWSLRHPKEALTVCLNACDDELISTFGLHDMFVDLSQEHKLTICVQGVATLMPSVVLQAAHTRVISKNSTLSLVPPPLGNSELDPVASRKRDRFINRLYDEALELLGRRSTMDAAQLRRRIGDSGWTLSAEKAKEYGFVDRIG
jgi:ATP-dependent protease ClpP protease subunit